MTILRDTLSTTRPYRCGRRWKELGYAEVPLWRGCEKVVFAIVVCVLYGWMRMWSVKIA